jgi:AhpD family alkylhydroperoxidase
MTGVFVRVARRGAQEQINHVSVVRAGAAQGRVAEIYAQMERDFGILAPPVILHSPAPDNLAAAWVMLRETLIAAGRADRAAKEAVAAAVSLGNACPYCVEVHSMTLHGLIRGGDAGAISRGRIDLIRDPRIRSLAAWAGRTGIGRPAGPEGPFPSEQAPELLGVAAAFHYYNRVVNVFLGESPFPSGVPARARAGLRRFVGRFMGPRARRPHPPGASLHFLPAAPLPADLSWTSGDDVVADALARSAAAIDAAGERAVPDSVRALLTDELDASDGAPPPLGRDWIEDTVARLPDADRAAGRLVLLTALASYRVDQRLVDDFRRVGPGDDTRLVQLVSWAAFAAARRSVAAAGEDRDRTGTTATAVIDEGHRRDRGHR